MITRMLFVVVLFFNSNVEAKLIDKILAVIDADIITHSQIERIKSNVPARQNISPIIYKKTTLSNNEVIDILIAQNLIRDKLTELGYVISDDQVESNIKDTERRLGLNRKALLAFLDSNNISFDEYFELIRQSIEFNIFNARVISPLITITEQEIKNTFYKENASNKTLSFKYTLIDYTFDKNNLKTKPSPSELVNVVTNYHHSNNLPKEYSSLERSVVSDIGEDSLSSDVYQLLKKTDEGAFSTPVNIGNVIHIFYVKKKDAVESDLFLAEKDRIRNELYEKSAIKITELWFQREKNKHYIKYFN